MLAAERKQQIKEIVIAKKAPLLPRSPSNSV